ncbi:MAG: hypothetical protein ACYSSI_02040 [Planctomycetota bacterium]|jgi:hypothetical protein
MTLLETIAAKAIMAIIFTAIQRWVILVMLAMGFLTWILLRNKQLTGRIFLYTSRFRKKTKFVYYGLLDSLKKFA